MTEEMDSRLRGNDGKREKFYLMDCHSVVGYSQWQKRKWIATSCFAPQAHDKKRCWNDVAVGISAFLPKTASSFKYYKSYNI
jgi:hypothetical protein